MGASQFFSFLIQQSGQGLVLGLGALYFFWSQGAPLEVLYCATAISGAFIAFEKVRSIFNGRSEAGTGE